jgi:hypothetical protein
MTADLQAGKCLETANDANHAKETGRLSTDFGDWHRFLTENRELKTDNCFSTTEDTEATENRRRRTTGWRP